MTTLVQCFADAPGETYMRFDCDRLIPTHPSLPRLSLPGPHEAGAKE